jgi:hypothetical protein
MKINPFTSQTFVDIWSKHFNDNKSPDTFEFIKDVKFVKHKWLPFYFNVGKNLTKGIYYSINSSSEDYKNKTFLVFDVPAYFNVEDLKASKTSSLRLKKVFQYKGFLMDLSNFENLEGYMKTQFKVQNKRYIRWSHINRLEDCFNISYKFFYGKIEEAEYNLVFEHFYRLLDVRFSGKRTNYHHLKTKKWNYYKDLVLPMIRENRASFLVIYNHGIPIGINLNFHSEDTLFKAITVYDVNYSRFSIGKLSVIKIVEWCFENNYKISDFTKGDFDYKRIWSNVIYDFDYHILYDSKSIVSIITAAYLVFLYKFKIFLRDKNLNVFYRKIIFKFKTRSHAIDGVWGAYKVEKLTDFKITEAYKVVDFKLKENSHLLASIYSFLFENPESIDNIKVYEDTKALKTFIIVGSKITQKTVFN